MADFTVVGSGPSGVHFALSALKRGHSVQIVDVGWSPNEAVNPSDSFVELKHNLDDPAAYFLGENNEGVLLPGDDGEFYGIPPSKAYALRSVAQFDSVTHNFEPLVSFARGGLAEMWTGGCYAFNDAELEDFPFGYDEIAPYYRQIAERIGINGMQDDLSDRIPIQTGFQPPLRLDNHSALLLSRYESKRKYFQDQLGCSCWACQARSIKPGSWRKKKLSIFRALFVGVSERIYLYASHNVERVHGVFWIPVFTGSLYQEF